MKTVLGAAVIMAVIGIRNGGWAKEEQQSNKPAKPDEAIQSEPFRKGKIASEDKSWNLAVRYFEEAREAFPESPAVLYELGRSNSNLSNWVASIVFLRAYLESQANLGGADDRPKVHDSILNFEVLLDKQVAEFFSSAMDTCDALPQGPHRAKANAAVLREMARAGRLEELRKRSREQSIGAVGGIAEAAHWWCQKGRIDLAEKLFEVAEEIALIEPLNPHHEFSGAVPFNPVTPAEVEQERERKKREDEKYQAEEPKRRLYYQGTHLVYLSLVQAKAGFVRRGRQTYDRGREFLRQTPEGWGLASGSSIEPGDFQTISRREKLFEFWNRDGLFWPVANGRDPAPQDFAASNWLGVIDLGRRHFSATKQTLSPPFSFGEFRSLDVVSELRAVHLREPSEIPASLAQLASKLGVAAEFLRKNAHLQKVVGK